MRTEAQTPLDSPPSALTLVSPSCGQLFLNVNAITDEGAVAIAASLRDGAAPKLKIIDLSGNPKVSETAKLALSEARVGLTVTANPLNSVAPKQAVEDGVVVIKKKAVSSRAEKDKVKLLYQLAFEQTDKLMFSDLKLGDAEVEVLSQALYSAKGLKKLFLNGNSLTDDGAEAIASALREGAAPQLKIINLSQKQPLSEATKRCIKGSREGLKVSFAALKQATDAPVYMAADNGKLKPARVIERAQNTIAGTGQQLVDGSGATCAELQKIIDVDRAALTMERAKLNSKVGKKLFEAIDPDQIKTVEQIEQRVDQQLQRLDKLKATKGCAAVV